MITSKPDFSLAIPLYNEEGVIEKLADELVREFSKDGLNYEIVLVDNGSRDNTGKIIDGLAEKNSKITPIHVTPNAGFGGGILAGLNAAKGKFIGFSTGGSQVTAKDILKVYYIAKSNENSVCKGKRLWRESISRTVLAAAYNVLFSLLFMVLSPDVDGYPVIMSREIFHNLDIKSKNFVISPEIYIKAKTRGYKLIEVPVLYRKRVWGTSHLRIHTIFSFIGQIFQLRMNWNKL